MKFLLFLLGLVNCYNLTQINIGVWLSGAAYCDKNDYRTMQIGGEASGFILKDILYDFETDIQGFTGIIDRTETIYVVLRGSSSIMNWIDDFEISLIEYTTYPSCDCKVHKGFYNSALSIRVETIESIKRILQKYPTYKVIVTGHSYGAGTGQLLAMELEREGINVEIYNYGQPRVGDKKYAGFVNTKINNYWRVTHNKDIVPHFPPNPLLHLCASKEPLLFADENASSEAKEWAFISGAEKRKGVKVEQKNWFFMGLAKQSYNYEHSCREVFEDVDGVLNLCNETCCEDPKCSAQFRLVETNIQDHLYYLGHRLACGESTLFSAKLSITT